MQEKRHDCVVEMWLCFFSRKAGDYKMLFVATRKCRSTQKEDYEMLRATDKITALYCRLSVEDTKDEKKNGKEDLSNSIQNQDGICQGGSLQKLQNVQ